MFIGGQRTRYALRQEGHVYRCDNKGATPSVRSAMYSALFVLGELKHVL
jgi:hypothetical protein